MHIYSMYTAHLSGTHPPHTRPAGRRARRPHRRAPSADAGRERVFRSDSTRPLYTVSAVPQLCAAQSSRTQYNPMHSRISRACLERVPEWPRCIHGCISRRNPHVSPPPSDLSQHLHHLHDHLTIHWRAGSLRPCPQYVASTSCSRTPRRFPASRHRVCLVAPRRSAGALSTAPSCARASVSDLRASR